MLGEVAVRMIFIFLLAHHLRPTFGTSLVDAALTSRMW
jgi:hypothetical protein